MGLSSGVRRNVWRMSDEADRTKVWPYDPEPFESKDHDNDETIYNETIIYQ